MERKRVEKLSSLGQKEKNKDICILMKTNKDVKINNHVDVMNWSQDVDIVRVNENDITIINVYGPIKMTFLSWTH